MKVEVVVLPDDTDVQANCCIHGVDRHYQCYLCLEIMKFMFGPRPN